jgi:pimeloyl-ACP methyl ester carboxylesterase
MNKLAYLITILVSVIILTNCRNEIKSGFAEINGARLYYEMTGEGTPLVFIHGFTCDHRNWNPQVEYFSRDFKVITYDARGHGKSSVPDTVPYTHAEDLAAFIDYFGIEPAVVIGHSMGGAPAFFYAINNPDKVLALVLAEGGAMMNDPSIIDTTLIPEYFNEFRSAIIVAQNEGLDKGKEAWLNIHPLKTAAQNPISAELLKTMINEYSGWHWLNNNPHKRNPEGTIELMNQISCPTLLIGGDLSHPAIKDAINAQSKYIPKSKKVILSNSNHMLNIENPVQFNNELEIFLRENDIK